MRKSSLLYHASPYILFAVLSAFSLCLVFSRTLWFDEAYTLSLIRHGYGEITEILKTDMHPPLYFLSLKLFCDIFGYSLTATKIFSAMGYMATLLLGCTLIKKLFGPAVSLFYMLTAGAVPMSLYFSAQQRSYSWCIFFVVLCFTAALLFLREGAWKSCILFTGAGLFAAYNHLYALLATAILFAFVNIYAGLKKRELLPKVLLADAAMVLGYAFWLVPLLYQTKAAAGGFWLTGLEPLSLLVFAAGCLVSGAVLIKKENRNLPVVFAIVLVLGLQLTGLLVSLFLRPLYIARYSVVVLGVFALLAAFCLKNTGRKWKKILCAALCIGNIAGFAATAAFEYNPSMPDFLHRFTALSSPADTFVYCDEAFGVLSYCYPENRHLCTYSKPWFSAFSHVTCIGQEEVAREVGAGDTVWLVKNTLTDMPQHMGISDAALMDTFQCDFNRYEVYRIKIK